MEDLRTHFPVLDTYTYLNTASCGLLSKPLVDWRHEQDTKLMQLGSVKRDTHKPHIEKIRANLADFCKAQADEVALVPNFSFGLNTLIEGLSRGKKVLLLKNDYPSINWPFEHRDFDVSYAEINENLEQNIEQAIAENHPDIIALSLVQYLNGIKIDQEFLKRLKAYHPNLLIIADGTQYLGMESFNFAESGIDVLGCSAYKWLLSGYGCGFFMVKKEAQKKIHLSTIGFNSADAIFSKQHELPFVKRFEPGHLDILNYGSMGESIRFLSGVGMGAISEKNSTLSKFAKARFSKLGLLEEAVEKRERHSTIFNLKGNVDLFEKLKKNNIICSQRGKGIRVSFHFYNTEDEIEKLVGLFS